MTSASAVYVGHVTHNRFRPRQHSLRHRVYWLLLDLEELDDLQKRLKLFSCNSWNVLSFYETDHGDRSEIPLREQLFAHLESADIVTKGVSIQILCMPRVLGYVFNPISVYYCRDQNGEAVAMIYEVNNTFSQSHTYVIPATPSPASEINQESEKQFYVSPFLDLDMSYAFKTNLPGDKIHLSVQAYNNDGPIINTALRGKRLPLSDSTLLSLLFTHPLLTLKVIAAIHWHALRMWLKGFKLKNQPPAPKHGCTIVRTDA